MAKEYIEREALLNAIPKPFEKDEKISQWGAVMDCIVIATSIPAADVVEVVRCKDCKYKKDYKGRVMCRRTARVAYGVGWVGLTATDDDHFCSHGERKEV